jgi:hypothetical protein
MEEEGACVRPAAVNGGSDGTAVTSRPGRPAARCLPREEEEDFGE